jgi:hypothetical protein
VLWCTRRREALLLAVVLAYAAEHSLIVGRMRYRITALPLVFVLAGAGGAALVAAPRDCGSEGGGRLGRHTMHRESPCRQGRT